MSQLAHRMYIITMVCIVVLTIVSIGVKGIPYYRTSLEERFYHPDHNFFKPSGTVGHGLGIVGTLLIVIGVFTYIARKRYRFLSQFGRLKYWLEFHIFLCILGPIMILFHTTFKFGGIVSISFWSMVAVVISGVIGRFIYIQIPRTIEGREMSLDEIKGMKNQMNETFKNHYHLDENTYDVILNSTLTSDQDQGGNLLARIFNNYFEDKKRIKLVKNVLRENKLSKASIRQVSKLIKSEISLNNKIERLQAMQQLFKYWHIAHLPFAIIMMIIMVVHVAIVVAFGARWVF